MGPICSQEGRKRGQGKRGSPEFQGSIEEETKGSRGRNPRCLRGSIEEELKRVKAGKVYKTSSKGSKSE